MDECFMRWLRTLQTSDKMRWTISYASTPTSSRDCMIHGETAFSKDQTISEGPALTSLNLVCASLKRERGNVQYDTIQFCTES